MVQAVYGIGFLAQALFSARTLVQWIGSERVRYVVTPSLYWKLSVIASVLMFVYGWLRDDFAIVLGQTLTYGVYLRNLHLQKEWEKLSPWVRTLLLGVPAAVVLYGLADGEAHRARFFHNEAIPFWLLVWGSAAQILFTLRFVYQWIVSEKMRRSHLPAGFWVLSLMGSGMIVLYALWRKDPVLLLGQLFGTVVYWRNLRFILRERRGRVR